ncbi:MAG: hypothetical protein ACI8S6_003819 [Myxococcota bacterium]|jgi:hypothetical protein
MPALTSATLLFSAAFAAPNGSYLDSCIQVTSTPRVLMASCRTISGDWQQTALHRWAACEGEIANRDGTLTCEVALPGGSYQRTCTDIVLHGDALEASCETIRGDWLRTWLPQATSCHADLANLDGILTCTG